MDLLGFLRDFLTAFRFCPVTGEEVVAFARERLPGAVDYDGWLHGTGLPAGAPAVASPLLDAVGAIGQAAPEPDVAATWSADEWQVYLAGLQPPVPSGGRLTVRARSPARPLPDRDSLDVALEADDAEILRREDVQAGRRGPAWTS